MDIDRIIYRTLDHTGLWHCWIDMTEEVQNQIRDGLLMAIRDELADSVATNPPKSPENH